ncbi:adenosylcobinamide amidohydrolase [Candidatus Nitrospira allomarina]|uniref:Adenosylcobinamide amidohydrolase n=1 Tax=Candidatus Nitrospira allomarina TaxID=3020900 RepID=A0AA96JQR4_9BACT|nr:adenosylcobinamide amidohydrolase [Candidatus Nitrospira allomarina]WNM56727.1 adenosylcobinamide amidohydrolase [Candidatus Nitrospira allomarina]
MISPLQIDLRPNCLIARFPGMFTCLSWAPWNGGEASASGVANFQVGRNGSSPAATPAEDLGILLKAHSLIPEETIGLMTAATVGAFANRFLYSSGAWVHVLVTVGLSNARSILDEADVELGHQTRSSGTVNVVVATNALPTIAGRIEAIHIASSAKTAAFRDRGVTSRKSNLPADLTGTDCLVVGASGEIEEDHCGLHTVLGEMIARAVYTSVSEGIAKSRKAEVLRSYNY